MNKTELIKAVGTKLNVSNKQADAILDAVVETIVDALKAGDKVQISGLGIFEVKERKARTGVNPQTGEEIKIEACKVPAFKAAKNLKEAVK